MGSAHAAHLLFTAHGPASSAHRGFVGLRRSIAAGHTIAREQGHFDSLDDFLDPAVANGKSAVDELKHVDEMAEALRKKFYAAWEGKEPI